MIEDLRELLPSDTRLMAVMDAVASLGLPDGWVTAGVIRNLVWDRAHHIVPKTPWADIDVVYFDPNQVQEERDRRIEEALEARMPGLPWSVRNQARMHLRNGDTPYVSSADALRHWVERCSAIGARRTRQGIEILAPFGVDDIFDLVVRPTPRFASNLKVFHERVRRKAWTTVWPRLRIEPPPAPQEAVGTPRPNEFARLSPSHEDEPTSPQYRSPSAQAHVSGRRGDS